MRTRDEILDRLERASLTHDAELRRRLLSFVVVGGIRREWRSPTLWAR